MKIGILTLPLHTNYGGILQNYALQQVLKRDGHSVETIDYSGYNVSNIRLFLYNIKEDIKDILFPQRLMLPYNPNERELKVIRRNTNCFIEKYISKTKPLYAPAVFDDIVKNNTYSAYVVGSDQCWRPKYNVPFLQEMFLHFANKQSGVKRIAYAASFGTSEWEFPEDITKMCAMLVRKFDLVTVREKSGIELCKEHFGIEAKHVLDPTLLLDKEDYIKLVENESEPRSEGTLFYYILDPSEGKKALIEEVASKMKLDPFTKMPKYQAENRIKYDVKRRIKDCIFPSVTAWLRAFMDAEMVIIDSFHGAVFSIIFNKPFWVIGNSKRGNARFDSLLGLFGLEDRMIIAGEDIEWGKPIDWSSVNGILKKERIKSKTLLQKTLNK